MAQRSHVPKFGNWENDDNVPYTVYFEKARKGKRGGKMINPNDPKENPEMFQDKTPPGPRSQARANLEEPVARREARPAHDVRVSKEDVNEDPVAPNKNTSRRTSGDSGPQRGGQGAGVGRGVRSSGGSEQSFERSPLHPHYQAKVTDKGSGSPNSEGKNSYDSSHGAPGRSRMKPARGDDPLDKGPAIPRFGDWDDKNPSSGDNYTDIFNKVRKERANRSPMGPSLEARPDYNIPRTPKANDKKCLCFPWFK